MQQRMVARYNASSILRVRVDVHDVD